jgi:hypothetical protein
VPEFTPTPPAFPEFSLPSEADAASEAPTLRPADPFATETMAELYLSQGHYADALRVYRELEAQRPGDPAIWEKITQVEALLAPPPVSPTSTVPVALEELPEPTADEALRSSPGVERSEVPEMDHVSLQGPTIRQFLGSLAMRTPYAGNIAQPAVDIHASAQPEAPAPAPAQEDAPSLDFDVPMEEVEYEEASVVTEEIVALEPPRSDEPVPGSDTEADVPEPGSAVPGGSIDALFDGADVTRADSSAASMLASAFGPRDATLAAEPAPISGSPARRASHELSLDTVFRDDAAQAPAPATSFSFDQFFAAPTPAAGSPVIHPTPGPSGPATEDDIEQFNSWLQGLKKR